MNEQSIIYQEFFKELTSHERNGVKIIVDGLPASPMQVISAHMVQEENTYMRDYVVDDDGNLSELYFQRIKNEK